MKEFPIQEIDLFAGEQGEGKPVVERLAVIEPEPNIFQLVKSPGFLRGIARGDVIKVDKEKGSYTLVKRAGNLCIRVIAKNSIAKISGSLVPAMEKLGASLDYENERMLIFSIHVSCGFQAIEQILNSHVGKNGESSWIYGNVYSIVNGELVPMNWWQEFLKPE